LISFNYEQSPLVIIQYKRQIANIVVKFFTPFTREKFKNGGRSSFQDRKSLCVELRSPRTKSAVHQHQLSSSKQSIYKLFSNTAAQISRAQDGVCLSGYEVGTSGWCDRNPLLVPCNGSSCSVLFC